MYNKKQKYTITQFSKQKIYLIRICFFKFVIISIVSAPSLAISLAVQIPNIGQYILKKLITRNRAAHIAIVLHKQLVVNGQSFAQIFLVQFKL